MHILALLRHYTEILDRRHETMNPAVCYLPDKDTTKMLFGDQKADMSGCEACEQCASIEFQPENIAPIYDNRIHFLTSQWKIPWSVYVAYRVTVALLIVTWIMVDFLQEAGKYYTDNYFLWFIFATNWNFILMGVVACFHATLVVSAFIKSKGNLVEEASLQDKPGLTMTMMVFWILFNCAVNAAIVVTLSYWSFLAGAEKAGFLIDSMSQLKHSLNTIYVISDLMISAMPIRIFHVVYPLFWGAIYTIFNVLYFTNNGLGPNGHPYAYYVMDWRKPLESALACSIGFVFSTVVQGLIYGLYRLRLCVHDSTIHTHNILDHRELLCDRCEQSTNEGEFENILGVNRNRTASYYSTGTVERGATTCPDNAETSADVTKDGVSK